MDAQYRHHSLIGCFMLQVWGRCGRHSLIGCFMFSGLGEVWTHSTDAAKFGQFGWRCTNKESSYSDNTLVGNWNEKCFDVREQRKAKPLPSDVSTHALMHTHTHTHTHSGGSRISPRRGRQLLRGGRQHKILPKFPKNCMKLKEFGPGGHPKFYYVDLPLHTHTHTLVADLRSNIFGRGPVLSFSCSFPETLAK